MATLASTRSLARLPCKQHHARRFYARNSVARLPPSKVISELAGLADVPSATYVSAATELASALEVRDVGHFILEHPAASFAISVAALLLVPKLIEAFLRYLAVPVAIALVAFYSLEHPEESATLVTTVLGWVNGNPELTSVLVIGLALFGLAPALLAAFGATALIYALLSLSFGTQLPEVRQMQGEFSETVTRVQFLGKAAGARVQQLLK